MEINTPVEQLPLLDIAHEPPHARKLGYAVLSTALGGDYSLTDAYTPDRYKQVAVAPLDDESVGWNSFMLPSEQCES